MLLLSSFALLGISKNTFAQNPNTELKQTTTTTNFNVNMACASASQNSNALMSYSRVFNLSTYNTNALDSFQLRNIKFGTTYIESISATDQVKNIIVNLYRVNGAYSLANRTLLATATHTITVRAFSLLSYQNFTVPIEYRVGANETIALEYVLPDNTPADEIYMTPLCYTGAETGVGYTTMPSCTNTDPVSMITRWTPILIANGLPTSFAVKVEGNGEFFSLPPQPNPFIVKSDSICAGKSGITYTIPAVPGATHYSWNYTGGGVSINGTGTTVTLDASLGATSGNLEVRAGNYYGLGPIRSTSVTVIAPSNLSITPLNPTICAGGSVQLEASPGYFNYSWEPPTGLSSLNTANTVASPANNHSYTVIAEDNIGCTAIASVLVTVNQGPHLTINPSTLMVCGDSLDITVSGAASYSWAPTNGLSNPLGDTLKAKPSSTTNYIITALDSTGCASQTNATITVNNFNVGISANGKIVSTTPNMSSYLWYKDGEIIIPHSIFYQHNAKSDGMYKAFVTAPNGCSGFTNEILVKALSINNLDNNLVKIFPNPSNGIVNIECDFEVNYKLYSIDGKLMTAAEKSKKVDISSYNTGLYYLVVEEASTKATASFKIMKTE